MRKLIRRFKTEKKEKHARRKLTIRKKIHGTAERPRVCTIKSNKSLNVQVVNDDENKILFSLSTFGKNKVAGATKTKEGAKVLGVAVASKLQEKGVSSIVFDRHGNKYHGVISSLADGIRENNIKF